MSASVLHFIKFVKPTKMIVEGICEWGNSSWMNEHWGFTQMIDLYLSFFKEEDLRYLTKIR